MTQTGSYRGLVASQVPIQSAGCAVSKRSDPIGGRAYGTPRNWMTVFLSEPRAVSTATPCRVPCPGMEMEVTDGNRSKEKNKNRQEFNCHSLSNCAILCCDWPIGLPVLRYTWRAGSLMTSLQEEVGLDLLGVELSPQAVVSG